MQALYEVTYLAGKDTTLLALKNLIPGMINAAVSVHSEECSNFEPMQEFYAAMQSRCIQQH